MFNKIFSVICVCLSTTSIVAMNGAKVDTKIYTTDSSKIYKCLNKYSIQYSQGPLYVTKETVIYDNVQYAVCCILEADKGNFTTYHSLHSHELYTRLKLLYKQQQRNNNKK